MEAVLPAAVDRSLTGARPAQADPSVLERVSLERVFVEHKERVFRAAYRVTGSVSDSEDVVQSVFLKLARRELGDIVDDIQNITLARTVIGNRVRITYHAVVLSGVTIEDDAMVGSMGLASKSVPAGVIAAGIPARPIGRKKVLTSGR